VRGEPIIRVVFELVIGNVTEVRPFRQQPALLKGAFWEILRVITDAAVAEDALHYWKYHYASMVKISNIYLQFGKYQLFLPLYLMN
jgi:hypothetical protein